MLKKFELWSPVTPCITELSKSVDKDTIWFPRMDAYAY